VQALVKYAGGDYLGPLPLPEPPAGETGNEANAPDRPEERPPLPSHGGPGGQPTGEGSLPEAPDEAPNGPWGRPAAGPGGGR